MDDSILLPSQLDLLERLQHNFYYSQQLQVLTGHSKSGKTRLLTQLASNIEDYDFAFIACPKHSEDVEIRRKIWVQLCTTPIFDDEAALTDTLINIENDFARPIIIILDDAHRLSHQIWAELLALSQMQVDNRPVAVVASSDNEFFDDFIELLPKSHQGHLQSLAIESLSVQEQDALYLSLLANANQQSFSERKLEKPDFTEGERYVGDITELFLDEATTPNSKRNKNKLWLLWSGLTVMTLVALVLLNWQFGWLEIPKANEQPKAIKSSKSEIFVGAITALQPVKTEGINNISTRFVSPVVSDIDNDTKQKEPKVSSEALEAVNTLSDSEAEPTMALALIERPSHDAESLSELPLQTTAPFEPNSETRNRAKPIDTAEQNDSSNEQKTSFTAIIEHPEGFTLQIASVSKQRSLTNILNQLKPYSAVKVARFNKHWVVVVGDFSDRKTARQFEKKLSEETSLPKPWLRKWKALKQFEFQSTSVQ
ncbi:hypothetical protein D5R81_11795 [Parashewanella spongiae]|uniref:SPOR domain-containing protein n=1 Tax=Parashewanella spongiae TaxID=342950 RepID=A0A3A6TKR8_9GAMM|nr:AAA family ATPase [Parashewanella spongiae]MCL1078594.1 AAA family ATPase [Parashewanella spongiae]RJY13106.1 hypothetical protein D5R81_11795 [Parashewanella spongiae]